MTTGVVCKIDRHCPNPAPAETGICSAHQREIRIGQLLKSPSLTARLIGRAWSLVAEYEPEAE